MAAELNPASVPAIGYPVGVHFQPTYLELITDYLAKKIENEKLDIPGMPYVDVYKHNPETLTETYSRHGKNDWYFFSPRRRKYKNGKRPDRAAGTGYWKARDQTKPIFSEDNRSIVGYRKALVFHEGKYPVGKKTYWVMQEFTIDKPQTKKRKANDKPQTNKRNANDKPQTNKRNADDMTLDHCVLCRIYKCATEVRKSNKQEAETRKSNKQEAETRKSNKQEAKTFACSDLNYPPVSTEVNNPEIANDGNLAQIPNFQDNIGVDDACIDLHHPPQPTEVNIPETANDGNLAQISNIQDNIGVDDACIDLNYPPLPTDVNIPEIANDGNLAQISNIQDNVGVDVDDEDDDTDDDDTDEDDTDEDDDDDDDE